MIQSDKKNVISDPYPLQTANQYLYDSYHLYWQFGNTHKVIPKDLAKNWFPVQQVAKFRATAEVGIGFEIN